MKEVLSYRTYESVGEHGVTSLSKPRFWAALKKKHPEVDCLDLTSKIDSQIGTGFHMVAEEAMKNSLIPCSTEVKLEGTIDGFNVGGTADLILWSNPTKGRICDWKTMKAYPAKKAFNGEELDRFKYQLSIYAYLLRQQGYETEDIGYIYVVVVGWTKRDRDLSRIFRIDIPLMSDSEVEDYVGKQVRAALEIESKMDAEEDVTGLMDCPSWMCQEYCELREVCPHFNNTEFKKG